MNRLHLVCLFAVLIPFAALGAPPASSVPAIDTQVIFDPRSEGYASCRIPGIVTTPRGTLLAYCEARRNKGGDWGPIDLLLRRSTDGGRTWSATQRVAGQGATTCNNPLAIADQDGVVHFLYCVGYARC